MPRTVAKFSCSVEVRMRLGYEQAVESQGLQQCLLMIHLAFKVSEASVTWYQGTKNNCNESHCITTSVLTTEHTWYLLLSSDNGKQVILGSQAPIFLKML